MIRINKKEVEKNLDFFEIGDNASDVSPNVSGLKEPSLNEHIKHLEVLRDGMQAMISVHRATIEKIDQGKAEGDKAKLNLEIERMSKEILDINDSIARNNNRLHEGRKELFSSKIGGGSKLH